MRIIASVISPKLPGRAVVLALFLLGASANALAGKWTITEDISGTETYTDNAALTATPSGGEFVTQVTPGIHVDGAGARFKGHLDYTPSFVLYSRNTSQDQVINTLNATGTLEAVENFFYIDGFSQISQTFASPFAPQPTSLTNFTSNRIQTRTYGISPYVRGHAGLAFDYELRYRDTWTTTNSSSFSNQRTTEWIGHAASPITLFGWALDYDDSTIGYGSNTGQNLKSQLGRATLYYQPDITLKLSIDAGREDNNYTSFETKSNGIYGAGASWRPTPTTSADFNIEHRYFGTYRLASFNHRTRLTAWSLNYSNSASNFQQLATAPLGTISSVLDTILAARIPDPAQRQAAVQQFLLANGIPATLPLSLSFFTQQIVLQETLNASFGILGKRSSVFFNAFRAKTKPLTDNFNTGFSDVFAASQSPVTQTGFGLNASHQLTGLTSLSASAYRTYSRQDQPSTLDSRNDTYTLGLTRTLSPKTSTFGGVSYTHFTSSGSAAASTSDSRSVYVGLTHRF